MCMFICICWTLVTFSAKYAVKTSQTVVSVQDSNVTSVNREALFYPRFQSLFGKHPHTLVSRHGCIS